MARATRPSNQNAHPGRPDMPAPHRTSAQVQVAVNMVASQKKAAKDAKAAKVKSVEAYQKIARDEAERTDDEAAHPAATLQSKATHSVRPLRREGAFYWPDNKPLASESKSVRWGGPTAEGARPEWGREEDIHMQDNESSDKDTELQVRTTIARLLKVREAELMEELHRTGHVKAGSEKNLKRRHAEVDSSVHTSDKNRKKAKSSVKKVKPKAMVSSGLTSGWKDKLPNKATQSSKVNETRTTAAIANAHAALEDVFANSVPTDSDTASMFENGGLQDDEDVDVKLAAMMTRTKVESHQLVKVVRPPKSSEVKPAVKLHKPKDSGKAAFQVVSADKKPASITTSTKVVTSMSSPSKGRKFTNKDLPKNCLPRWKVLFVPMWIDYIGTQGQPWSNDLVEDAQRLWDKVFPDIPSVLAAKGEPIFHVVSFCYTACCTHQIFLCAGRQCNAFTIGAVHSRLRLSTPSKKFFSVHGEELETKEDHAEFIAYALASSERNTSDIPFLWGSIDENISVHTKIHRGAFMSSFILRSLRSHLTMVQVLPDISKRAEHPIGAVGLASCAAERALVLHATGEMVKETWGAASQFSSDNWGDKTLDYVADLQDKSERGWSKLVASALSINEMGRRHAAVVALNALGSGSKTGLKRARCIDIESDDETINEDTDDGHMGKNKSSKAMENESGEATEDEDAEIDSEDIEDIEDTEVERIEVEGMDVEDMDVEGMEVEDTDVEGTEVKEIENTAITDATMEIEEIEGGEVLKQAA
ncbi:hypothetical protein EW146_g2581 [Bondarzewia mesenterica]|uniref:Uncharacterized protein n=1 Tax=Bondarzewia mesenterica TaxID=1095465 RepID=A0A4S4M1P3_9AGAM|nr:hypothetical protein EW146_g2581 [Bondarzewia mesenterica]